MLTNDKLIRLEIELAVTPNDVNLWYDYLNLCKRLNTDPNKEPYVSNTDSKEQWKVYHKLIRDLDLYPTFLDKFLSIVVDGNGVPYRMYMHNMKEWAFSQENIPLPSKNLCWMAGLRAENLTHLSLEGDRYSSDKMLESLAGLSELDAPKLSHIHISDINIGSLDALSGWKAENLSFLFMERCGLISLSGLKDINCPNLEYLTFEGNSLKNLDDLSGWKHGSLKILDFSENRIKNLFGFKGVSLPILDKIDLTQNFLKNLNGLLELDAPLISHVEADNNHDLHLSEEFYEKVKNKFAGCHITAYIEEDYADYDD
jgi:Leucine-rich repeat (LRR) protein